MTEYTPYGWRKGLKIGDFWTFCLSEKHKMKVISAGNGCIYIADITNRIVWRFQVRSVEWKYFSEWTGNIIKED